MDSSPTRQRRHDRASSRPGAPSDPLALARVISEAASADELDRMLLALALHPDGPGFERARLLLWDSERERFTQRVAQNAPDPGLALEEALARARFASARPENGGETPAAQECGPNDLTEPAASAWRHRVRIVANHAAARSGECGPRSAAAMLAGNAGPYALLLGEWNAEEARDDLDQALEEFVRLAEWALVDHGRRADERTRARQAAAVAELARSTASPCNLAEVLHQAVRLACLATGARGGALWLKRGEETILEITHGLASTRERLARSLQPLAAEVLASGRPKVSDCAADEALISPDAAAGLHALSVVPLVAYDRTLGALAVYDRARTHPGDPITFGRAERDTLTTLADLSALALDHAARFGELREAEVRHRELGMRLVRLERLAGLGETAARLGQEARHPVASIRTFARRAREALMEGAPEREYLEIVLREADRLERLLHVELDPTLAEPPTLKLQNLNDVVQGSLQRFGEVLVRRRIRMMKKLSPELPVLLIDADRIGQMMNRVIDSALEAVSIGGRIRVETRRSGAFAVIELAHDGPRSPGTALDHLFVPFANGRSGGAGVGLGIAQRIVREHGGEIRVRADGEWSTVVVFTLPIPDNQDRRHTLHDRRQTRNDRRRRLPHP